MLKSFLPLLAGALLMSGVAHAQAPATEVQALTTRLNQLVRVPKPEKNNEVLVSLADCGVRQTVRVYRNPDESPSSTNVNVSSSKNGSTWGVKSNEKVQLELTMALDWSEVAEISHVLKQDEKSGRNYYDLILKRRPAANGKSSGRITDTITLALHTDNEKEVTALERRLNAMRQLCTGQKG